MKCPRLWGSELVGIVVKVCGVNVNLIYSCRRWLVGRRMGGGGRCGKLCICLVPDEQLT